MKKSSILICVLLLCAVVLPLAAKGNNLTITGSTTVLPIAQAAAEAYMDSHGDVNISVRGGGSGVGIAALQSRTCEIASSSRPIKAKEISIARTKGVNPVGYIVANDGIAMVVNPSNPVKNLTKAQLKDIYTGKVTNWKQVGGTSMPIVIVSRDVASGTFEVFNEKVIAGGKLKDGALMLASNNAVVSSVSDTPGAIGYVGIGYLNDKTKAVAVDSVLPTEQTVKAKAYPLSRALYLYTDGTAKGEAARFISFLQSPAGQKIVTDQGFVSIK